MTENNSTIAKIPPFDGTNFSNWKFRVGILLDERGLRKYIDSDLAAMLTAIDDDEDETDKPKAKGNA